MKKIWVDLLTPKQVLFLKPLIENFRENNFDVYVTARRYYELDRMIELKGLKAYSYGVHGGEKLYHKLRSSLRRALNLLEDIVERDVDFAVSFSSVEAARVSFGLSIPHYCISDSPHAEAASKLTIPLSKLLFTPKAVPKKAWKRYGIGPEKILQYDALDPAAWLKGFHPDGRVLWEVGLDPERPIITVRPEEAKASYLLSRGGEESPISRFLEGMLKRKEDFQLVVLPRYLDQKTYFQTRFSGDERVRVSESPVDGASLTGLSNLFIGAGGTMTAEAALQGVPTISCYPSKPTYVERYLVRRGLIKRVTNSIELVKEAVRVIRKPPGKKVSAEGLLASMEDPVKMISQEILSRHEGNPD